MRSLLCALIRLFVHASNSNFGSISVTERDCAAPISEVESHMADRYSHLTG